MEYNEGQDDYLDKPFRPFKEKETPRALQTFLRNEYKVATQYASMVDRKANIMIHLNSFIISGLVIFSKVVDYFTTPEIIVMIFFVIAAIISLGYAALAARPIPLKKAVEVGSREQIKEHLFYWGHFGDLTQEEYERAFDTIMRDQSLIYKNMAKQLFVSQKVLLIKFKRLRNSYNVFLLGIGFTAIVFIIVRVINHF
jgi:hypothetical protein